MRREGTARVAIRRRDARRIIWLVLGAGLVNALLPSHARLGCPLRALTGVSCPVCGSTSSVASLIRGDVIGSVRANAMPLGGLLAAASLARGAPEEEIVVQLRTLVVVVACLWALVLVRANAPGSPSR